MALAPGTAVRVSALAAALALCYASVLSGVFGQWMTDEDMGHGILVLPVVAWILWRDRARLSRIPRAPASWGWAVLAAAGALHALSALGAGLFAGALSLWIAIAGVVILLFGLPMLRACLVPFLLCLFMLPKLSFVYNSVTLGLQLLAARLAELVLRSGGFDVSRDGNLLRVGDRHVTVAEACNGIRYLLPLSFLSVVFSVMVNARRWMYAAMLAAAAVVAIAANAGRVALAALHPGLLEGSRHMALGWAVFAVSILLLGAGYFCMERMLRRSSA